MYKIIFFSNGNTRVFKDGRQVPDLQESWFGLYVGLLYAMEIDATQVEFVMPDTARAVVHETEGGGFSWSIQREESDGEVQND
jgi:hypothetical protein